MSFPESQRIDVVTLTTNLPGNEFQSTSTNSDIQNSDMIGAKKNEQKNKTTQVSPAGFDMTRGNRAALL